MEQLILDLYTAFQNAQADFTTAGVPLVQTIDRFRGQPMNPEQFEYFELPALFFELSITWERINKVYNGKMAINFHLVAEPTWDTSNIATSKEAGLQYYQLLAQIRNVLDNFKCEFTSTFERTNDHSVDSGVVNYDVLGYSCDYYDPMGIGPVYNEATPEDIDLRSVWVKKL